MNASLPPSPLSESRLPATEDNILLTAENITVKGPRSNLLEGISVHIHEGEIVTLIGPNGGGKTTLARVLLGTLQPDGGIVRRKAGLVVGYVPQRLQIEPTLPLTVKKFLGLPKANGLEIAGILEDVEATHLGDTLLSSLSGGELQRVLLARALLRRPQLLVLDEPLQGVDVNGQLRFYEHLSQLRAKLGCAILMISHELHLVMAATDRVFCLNRHLCCVGKPEVVRQDPAFIHLFGPRAAQVLALYSHEHDHAHGWHPLYGPSHVHHAGCNHEENEKEDPHG